MSRSLSDRMKEYENVSNVFLTRKTPVVARIDGRAFHKFTKGFVRPYDGILKECMLNTTKKLCESIQGCVLGYTQSDEISLLLEDYEKITTDAWFRYRIQKIVSISASMATLYFNSIFENILNDEGYDYYSKSLTGKIPDDDKYIWNQLSRYYLPKVDTALFDSRVFNLPKEEVCNYFIWRQQDATRNSIQLLGQSRFSHKQLNKKSCNDIQDMLMKEYAINWNNIETKYKRGSCVIKKDERWIIDNEIPIFTQDREYIERLV